MTTSESVQTKDSKYYQTHKEQRAAYARKHYREVLKPRREALRLKRLEEKLKQHEENSRKILRLCHPQPPRTLRDQSVQTEHVTPPPDEISWVRRTTCLPPLSTRMKTDVEKELTWISQQVDLWQGALENLDRIKNDEDYRVARVEHLKAADSLIDSVYDWILLDRPNDSEWMNSLLRDLFSCLINLVHGATRLKLQNRYKRC